MRIDSAVAVAVAVAVVVVVVAAVVHESSNTSLPKGKTTRSWFPGPNLGHFPPMRGKGGANFRMLLPYAAFTLQKLSARPYSCSYPPEAT